MNQAYTICLGCGNVQIRTDIVEDLKDKDLVLIKNSKMCSKCHKIQQFVATKDIRKLKKSLSNTNDSLGKRVNNIVR